MNAGELTTAQLKNMQVAEKDVPEVIGIKAAETSKLANRLREQEDDLYTLIYQNQNGDNTMFCFSYPVKYIDENGTVKDKSTKISATSHRENYSFVSADNDIVTYFPTLLTSETLLSLEKDDVSITMYPINVKSQLKSITGVNNIAKASNINESSGIVRDSVTYANVFGAETSIRYSLTYEGIKEEIILEKRCGINKFEFKINIGSLIPSYGDDGSIVLKKPSSNEASCFLSPIVAYDSLGTEITVDSLSHITHKNSMSFSKLDNNGNYKITVVVDKDFLESPETEYPVYIDPSFTISTSNAQIEDTTIYYNSNVNYGSSTQHYPGFNDEPARSLFRFPGLMSNTTFKILRPSQVLSAKLVLRDVYPNSERHTITAYRVTQSWSENTVTGATHWYKYTGAMGSQIVYSNNGYSNSDGSGSSGYWYPFDITAAVKDWMVGNTYGHRNEHYGVMLKSNKESESTGCKYFAAKEYTLYPELRPRLCITYSALQGENPNIDAGAIYYLRSYYSGLFMDVQYAGGSGAALTQYEFNGSAAQQFKLVYVGNGLYTFIPQHNTSLRVDVPGAGDTNGLNWQVYTSNQSDAQYFSIIANNDGLGTYRIMPLCSNTKVLDIEGPSRSAANLQMWNWTSDAQQMKWFLLDVRDYYMYGVPLKNIAIQTVGVTGNSTWLPIIKAAANSWNSASVDVNITITQNESPYKFVAFTDYSSDDYAIYTPTIDNNKVTGFEIKINLAKMPNDSKKRQGIIAHEIGHCFYLKDNPPIESNKSLMNHDRDRSTIITPQEYDITNVHKRYAMFTE